MSPEKQRQKVDSIQTEIAEIENDLKTAGFKFSFAECSKYRET
jgi:hypothetical protein